MKTFLSKLLMIPVLFFGLSAFVTSVQNIDKGLGRLKINAPKSFLKPVLVDLDVRNTWYDDAITDTTISSGYIYDHQKAGIFRYYGLKIAHVEVFFGKQDDKTVCSFFVWFDKPLDDTSLSEFVTELEAANGEPSVWSDQETGKITRMEWFSDITRLSISLTANEVVRVPADQYYRASYVRAD